MSVGLLLQLYEACVPPTASYGCEVWGLHKLSPGVSREGRAALATLHLGYLKEIARVPVSVHTSMLLHELGQRPFHHLWWRRTIRFWNTLAALHDGDLFRQVAVDACRDAVTLDVHNWAWAFMCGLRAMGYEYTIRCDTLIPVDVANVMLLLDAPDRQLWEGLDICPRTCPSEDATLCTYVRWFARPAGLRQPGPLVMQPLSARCMRTLLRFRMGSHSLPIVLGRRTGVPRAQRLCQRCNLHALHDERHLVFECPAMQCVRDRYPALFSPAKNTMQLFMWQRDIVGVAHYIKDCFEVLGALDDAPDDASTSSSSALAAG